MRKIQVTLYSEHYKPVSAIVTTEADKITKEIKKELQVKGITKICTKRYWNSKDLTKYGYTKVRMRDVTDNERY